MPRTASTYYNLLRVLYTYVAVKNYRVYQTYKYYMIIRVHHFIGGN